MSTAPGFPEAARVVPGCTGPLQQGTY